MTRGVTGRALLARWCLGAMALATSLFLPTTARAAGPADLPAPTFPDAPHPVAAGASFSDSPPSPPASFALILGVNRSVDDDAPLLRYADDDAAKYQEMFRGLGAHTYVLARLDSNTARLHPQVAAEALEPKASVLGRVLDQLQADVVVARGRGVGTVVYVVYSGHGSESDGRAYVSLEDARLYGSDLDALIFDRLGAGAYHLIVDACDSYLLVSARGPGGQRREVHDFVIRPGVRPRRNLGLLLSTSAAGESHEWQGVESGVFSHEVRSGLCGAADADGDGLVTYEELASFVERANAAIPGDRFRPDIYARPPDDGHVLVDLRALTGHRIEIDGAEHAHYLLENSEGVQIAEFHNAPDQKVVLIQPGQTWPLYLRRVDDGSEFAIPLWPDRVRISALSPEAPPVAARGAAAHAFAKLFVLPFGPAWVRPIGPAMAIEPDVAEPPRVSWRPIVGVSLEVAATGAAAIGAAVLASAAHARSVLPAAASQRDAQSVNDGIENSRWQAGLLFGVGAAAATVGAVLLFGSNPATPQLQASLSGVVLRAAF
jgi:hypothetical protein